MVKALGLILLAATVVAGCASTPKFEKSNGTSGYTVTDLTGKNHFQVKVLLPSDTSADDLKLYAGRAVGEECAARGFDFFDFGLESPTQQTGFCYPTNERKALAIDFADAGLKASPAKFVIEDLVGKKNTLLKIGDEVLSIAGQKLTSMAQVKTLVFTKADKANTIDLEILRDGKTLKVKEPVALYLTGVLNKSDLQEFRRRIP